VLDNRRLTSWRVRAMFPASVGALALLLIQAPASAAASPATVCAGTLAPGTYHSIVVPAGKICDLGVGPVHVLAGVRVRAGATFILGFEHGPATGTISGGVRGANAAQVLVHNARINGGVSLSGGSGPDCAVPFGGPCANDLEDNVINGGATLTRYNGVFVGFIRNHVHGSVTISHNIVLDQIDIGTNTVHGSLICIGNDPLENTGGSPGPSPDSVTGKNTCHEVP